MADKPRSPARKAPPHIEDLERRRNEPAIPDYGPLRSRRAPQPAAEVSQDPLEAEPGGPMGELSSEQEILRGDAPLPGESIPIVRDPGDPR